MVDAEKVFRKISKRTELINQLEHELRTGADVFIYNQKCNYNLNDVIFDEKNKEYLKVMRLNLSGKTMRVINKYGHVDVIRYDSKGPLRSELKKPENPF